ncbi:MAG: type II secretion system GspH family protein [Candidatus Margulisbacteria bacterium]|nr:type II secretion system GspH family protein [Candidatus Margulisiibacteriota bacterium]
MNKNAFTMIELIFVIVILGILAAIAIPKLTATRDESLIVRELSDLKTAKMDVMSHVLITNDVTTVPANNLICFDVQVDSNKTLTITEKSNAPVYCAKAVSDANKSNMMESIQL